MKKKIFFAAVLVLVAISTVTAFNIHGSNVDTVTLSESTCLKSSERTTVKTTTAKAAPTKPSSTTVRETEEETTDEPETNDPKLELSVIAAIESVVHSLADVEKTKNETTEPIVTKPVKVSGYSKKAVVNYFCDVAFNGDGGLIINKTVKWTRHIYVYLVGRYNNSDKELLEELMYELNSIQGFPGVSFTRDPDVANMYMIFAGAATLTREIPSYHLADDGYAGLALGPDYSIRSAVIGIDAAMFKDSKRSSVICEEFIQAMGLAHDSTAYKYSIFYENGDYVSRPTSLDWAMVKILYNPGIKPGMTRSEVKEITDTFVKSGN